ncbi:hypothetical protein BC834DRAFT_852550 [Gloeopeniophorella convolvens]|nr:hypothetical protein BC834DRAFT_852550 [Gloeopeniophorella convolvens]
MLGCARAPRAGAGSSLYFFFEPIYVCLGVQCSMAVNLKLYYRVSLCACILLSVPALAMDPMPHVHRGPSRWPIGLPSAGCSARLLFSPLPEHTPQNELNPPEQLREPRTLPEIWL